MTRRLLRSSLCAALWIALALEAAADPPLEALVGEIPFHPESPPSRVMVDLAKEGNKPFVLMLDTGASDTTLTPGAARALGVGVRRTKSSPYRRATRLGRDVEFWIDTSVSDTGSKTGWDYGLLGGRFLEQYVLEIDYPGRMVRFYDPRKFELPERSTRNDEVVIPFRRNGTRIIAEIEIEGAKTASLLDTGAPALIVGGRTAKKIGIEWKELPELEGIHGVMGPIEAYTYEAKQVRFGGFEFPEQPITIAPRGNYNQGASSEVTLGYDILSRFVMRIDYRKKRIWLKDGGRHVKTYWAAGGGGTGTLPAVPVRPPPTDEEVAENDARQVEDWKSRRNTRVYAETSPGKFVVVDGYRLRQGPKDGEVWYSHEEMLARRAEVQAGAE